MEIRHVSVMCICAQGCVHATHKTAMTAIAPRSSTVASVSRNASAPAGMRDLKKLKTPIAKAMSVAIGTAQPAGDAPRRPLRFNNVYTPCGAAQAGVSYVARACVRDASVRTMGTTMPPSAPRQGSTALRMEASEP